MAVLNNGVWTQEETIHHQHSPKLAAWLINYLDKSKPVIDFGCGLGYYCAELEKNGFHPCIGIDGWPLKNHLNKHFYTMDLTNITDINSNGVRVMGNVLSLEVAEHVPMQYEQTFIDNVTKHCNGKLIFSWALPGQGGIGHVNLRPADYVITEVERRGFRFNEISTLEVRENIDDNTSWFRSTLLIFDKV